MKEKEKKIGYAIHMLAKCPWQQQSDGGLNHLFQFIEPKNMESLSFRLASLSTVYEAHKDEEDRVCFFTRLADATQAFNRLRKAKLFRGAYDAEVVSVWLRDIDQSIITKPMEEPKNG